MKIKEKISVVPSKYTNWPSVSQMGTWNITFIHRGNGRWQTEDKTSGTPGRDSPSNRHRTLSLCPIAHLPPLGNSGKFLDQGLPLLFLLPEEETMLSGCALIIHDMDRNIFGFHAIECLF
jgi:hypothetical protein